MIQSSRESGNVIFIILIGIVLFAALSYAVTGSIRSNGTEGANEKTNIQVIDILTFGNAVNNAVKALMLNGCTEAEISFDNPLVSGYENAGAPTNKSCNVFNVAGGGLTYRSPDAGLLDSTKSGDARYGQWFITSKYCFNSVGTGGNATCNPQNQDLVLFLPFITLDLCTKILTQIHGAPSIPGNYFGANGPLKFTGAYTSGIVFNSSILEGKLNGCMGSSVQNYSYFQVLIAR